MIFFAIKYTPPTSSKSADVSPIVPAVLPRNIAFKFTTSPAFNAARGVALVVASKLPPNQL